ncbi:Na+/H+ antiporter NhaC [Paenibacillus sp. 481]|uniref:Na+/H+ antiporter NhaC n=1 Tax=Paenibacillus sp. 481 TaxID=2835869 RepID=UPI001E3CA706|nr:Na+/H+ antiporter NhaC [Paenibacillus sp. 481]UHA72816.1 Na+/H+ antiporter NhaC [Paenibacillus sp. 481]
MNSTQSETVTFKQSIIIFVTIIGWLLLTILGWQAEPHVPLIIATILTGTLLMVFGQSWKTVEESLLKGLQSSVFPAMLLALIGVLIAVWMMSGTIPTLLVYGTSWFQPQWFTISALLLTVVVSMFVGSSLTTVGTFGVALIGMSESMGVHPAIVAGAVVSGACFGDKMSPLSDTTNFAAAISRVQIPDHIRNMTRTTIPAFVLTCIAFLFFGSSAETDLAQLQAMQRDISQAFHISPWTLLPLAVVLITAFKRLPILVSMLLGIGSGLVVAVIMQGHSNVPELMATMQHGFKTTFAMEEVGNIINRGGLQSMTWAMTLIAIAFSLGGLLQHGGVINALFSRVIAPVKRKETLVVSSGLSAIGVNVITGEQYMSILLPGQLFEAEYEKRGIPRLTLSRTLEDCGTLVNPLIPWGVSGAMMTSALGLTVLDYAPYAFFLWFSPLCTFAFALIPGLKRQTLGE